MDDRKITPVDDIDAAADLVCGLTVVVDCVENVVLASAEDPSYHYHYHLYS
jgi:hypothetical protein